ncbi:C6 finger domain protein [Seiridium cupressi]
MLMTHYEAGFELRNLIEELLILTTFAKTATFKPSNLPTDSIAEFAGNRAGARFWKDVCHYLGTAGLLKSGSDQEQQCSQSLDLYRAVRRPIVRAAILRGMNVQGWLKDAAAFGEQGPALMLDALMVRVAGLRAKALQIQHVAGLISSTLILSLEEILGAGQHLDLELSLWPHKITADYAFSSTSFDPPDRDKLPWCTSIAHNYRSYSHAAAWNRYRAARMIIHSLLVGTITQLAGHTTLGSAILGQLQMSLVAIASLSTEMCCSIPYFFNYNVPSSENIIPKVVTHLAWPLTVAIGIKTIPEVEKYWFRRTLRSVAVALGDSVLECISQGDEFEF